MLDLRNSFDYYLRSVTKFSRKNYSEDLEVTRAVNEYTFDILSQVFDLKKTEKLRVLDIGSKNWEYVRGEYKFFNQYCEEIELHGVEIDAYRLYANFYSRYEYAKFYAQDLNGASYYPDNLLNMKGKYDYIVWFLPFVTKYPLRKWGLPDKLFMPEKLLKHAYEILNKEMLILNQGEEEAEIQKSLLDKADIKYKELGILKSDALEYKNERYGFIIVK